MIWKYRIFFALTVGACFLLVLAIFAPNTHVFAGGPPFAGLVKTSEGIPVANATVHFCYDAIAYPSVSCTSSFTDQSIVRGQWGASVGDNSLGYFRFWAERDGVQTPSLTFHSRCYDCAADAGVLVFPPQFPPTPDLDFSYLGWNYASESSGFAGSAMHVTATVRNRGTAEAGSFVLQLRIDANHDLTWDAEPQSFVVGPLAPGAEDRRTWNAAWVTVPGWHRAYACIDSADAVRELDDQNNCVNIRFTVPDAADLSGIPDGALIRAAGDPDVYIVKYAGAKKFKRLILNPDVFNSYRHLHWEDIREVSHVMRDAYVTSRLVRAVGDGRVYALYASGDTGSKSWIPTADWFVEHGLDWDAIYEINAADRDSYTTGLEYGEG